MRRWRKMTWVLLLWSAFILVWAVVGGSSAADECLRDATTQLERDACEVGTGLGVAALLFIGFVGFVFLSLIWFMTRPKGRPCPRCGENVKRGVVVCQGCGFDFAAAAAPPGQPAGA